MEIPEKVRRTVNSMGEAGRAWLAALPQQIAELEERWAITVGQPARRGTEAFVAEARTSEGRDVILKVVLPSIDHSRQELCILRAANGIGYAELIRGDEAANTMLLEKLGPSLHECFLPEASRIDIICVTLRDAWKLPSDGLSLVTGADKAVELSRVIESCWSSLGRPCSERTVELALAYAERRQRAFDPGRSVVAHGDAHEWNTLRAPDIATGFKFIDPDGAIAERAFDLAVPMREWGAVMPEGDLLRMGHQRCRLLAILTGIEPQPIWEWALIQCVSNGLLLYQIGLTAPASVSLAMADAWATGGDLRAA